MIYKNIEIHIPKWVQYTVDTLHEFEYEAYVVGGCVRDSLLDKTPNDWDITTNALPKEVIDIFRSLGYKVIETGLKHGTVTVVINDENFEITTYRIDGIYSDGRHPDNVNFTRSLKEDLARRDFTINAMAYNSKEGLIDYFGGLYDLKEKVIRCVGIPHNRFSEDALRIMRAYRFAGQLGFNIEEEALTAILELKENLKNISIERIREELNKIMISDMSIFFGLYKHGILKVILPELEVCAGIKQDNPYHIYDVYDHSIYSAINIESKLHLKLTMLLHDIGKPECKTTDKQGIDHFYNHNEVSATKAEQILKRMKYDNKIIEKVVTLIKYHDREISGSKSIKKLLNLIGEESFKDLLKVKIADMQAQNLDFYKERYDKLVNIEEKLNRIIETKECFTIKDLAINGKDLINIGIKQGKEIGDILNHLLDIVLENPEMNTKEKLIEIIKIKI
ncbi:MAG: CCA tRNA nucleotidyltransferase [Clostridiaceae bacterium]